MSETGLVSTKLHTPQSAIANRYKAHVLLIQGRELDKQEAVNELVALGAATIFPAELLEKIGLELPKTNTHKKTPRKTSATAQQVS